MTLEHRPRQLPDEPVVLRNQPAYIRLINRR